jgi:hypothetical protein
LLGLALGSYATSIRIMIFIRFLIHADNSYKERPWTNVRKVGPSSFPTTICTHEGMYFGIDGLEKLTIAHLLRLA